LRTRARTIIQYMHRHKGVTAHQPFRVQVFIVVLSINFNILLLQVLLWVFTRTKQLWVNN